MRLLALSLCFTSLLLFFACEKEVPDPPVTTQGSSSGSSSSSSSSSGGSLGNGSSGSSSSSSGGNGCNYTQSYYNINCNSGYYPVTSSSCCSGSYPYYCSETQLCYQTSCDAEYDCSGGSVPIKANLNATGSSSSGSSSGSSGSSSSGSSSSGSTTGELLIWNSNSQPCPAGAGSTITVYVNGSYVGGISSYYTSAPSCGASGAITLDLSPGSYSVSAECGSNIWSAKSITVYAGSCSRYQLY